jgi:VanZ family protein
LKSRITFFQHPFYRYHLPVIILAVSLFILSSIPQLNPPDLGFEIQDKFYHFLFYAIFGYLIARSFLFLKVSTKFHRHYLVFSIIFAAVYGLSDEIHQYFVPGRFCSLGDFMADGLGATVGIFIFHYRQQLWRLFRKYLFRRSEK